MYASNNKTLAIKEGPKKSRRIHEIRPIKLHEKKLYSTKNVQLITYKKVMNCIMHWLNSN